MAFSREVFHLQPLVPITPLIVILPPGVSFTYAFIYGPSAPQGKQLCSAVLVIAPPMDGFSGDTAFYHNHRMVWVGMALRDHLAPTMPASGSIYAAFPLKAKAVAWWGGQERVRDQTKIGKRGKQNTDLKILTGQRDKSTEGQTSKADRQICHCQVPL